MPSQVSRHNTSSNSDSQEHYRVQPPGLCLLGRTRKLHKQQALLLKP